MNKKLRVFETFAGIGAQHKALQFLKENFGHEYEVVATSEWDIFANISYNSIHNNGKVDKKTPIDKIDKFFANGVWSKDGKTQASAKSLLNLDDETKRKAYSAIKNVNNLGSILDITGKSLVEATSGVDLITYSFPCQDLSVAGSFHGFNQGMAKGSGTRSGLLWEIERIMKQLKIENKLPKFLLLENVKNMISSRHKAHYNEWLKELKALGYSTKTFVLNSHDYGLPQARQRVYALSILNYSGEVDDNGEIIDMKNPTPITKRKPIEKLLRTNYNDFELAKEARESQPNRTISRERMFTKNYKLDSGKHKYCRTITTKQDRHPNAGVVNLQGTTIGDNWREKVNSDFKKANYRFMTPRETFLFMGFEDKDFENVKKENIRKEKLYQQAGNSIAVDVLIAIFNEMYKHW